MKLDYIITETNTPDSFDPLLADKGNNILFMRMLYLTPIQINSANELISNVLDEFEYNSQTFTISLNVKNNIGHFSDGTKISKEDVLYAILRLTYSMPNFPVIKDIVGIHEWINKKEGLTSKPKGISIEGNQIFIKLTKHNSNALFRFCLELFSIIPTHCINLQTATLNCKIPPFSGYYELADKNEREYKFILRHDISSPAEKMHYSQITFKYKTFEEACNDNIDKNTIISGTDLGFNSSKCSKQIKSEQIHWLQANRFGSVLFNPNVKPFDSSLSRQFYADKIRKYFKEHSFNLIVSKSIFTELLPGFLDDSDFTTVKDDFTPEKNSILRLNNSKSIVGQNVTNALIDAAKENNIKIDIHNDNNEVNMKNFLADKTGYILSSSGFWPQDPLGDISMYFTKNLHPTLRFVWQDKKMYQLIHEIENETNLIKVKDLLENLNRHLYEQSLIAPIIHFRRLYITHESIKSLHLPMAITSPAPWHLVLTE